MSFEMTNSSTILHSNIMLEAFNIATTKISLRKESDIEL